MRLVRGRSVDYREDVADLVKAQNEKRAMCHVDGMTCCSICVYCGRRFCDCAPDSCERELGRGCSATRGGVCPKGWVR